MVAFIFMAFLDKLLDYYHLSSKDYEELKREPSLADVPSFNNFEHITEVKERILKAQMEYTLDLKDQDIFNIVFKDHITSLGYEFNIDSHNLKEKEETKTVSELKDNAFNNPTIVHCMGKEKWWTLSGLHFGDYWDSFAKDLIPSNRKKCIIKGDLYIIRN